MFLSAEAFFFCNTMEEMEGDNSSSTFPESDNGVQLRFRLKRERERVRERGEEREKRYIIIETRRVGEKWEGEVGTEGAGEGRGGRR